MTHDATDPGNAEQRPARSGDVTIQELTWNLIDDQIESGEFQLLESMLLSDDAARDEYLNCVQLHADLMTHFAKPADAAAPGRPPVLGFLGGGAPPLDTQTAQQ